jgi:hypothetical protein
MTNLTHFFISLFITSLYMFRASLCPSSGDRIVLMYHLVWLVCVSECLVCRSVRRFPRASQCSSSGDRIVLIHHLVWLVCVSDCLVCRSVRREIINKATKRCVKLVSAKNGNEMHGQGNIKLYKALVCFLHQDILGTFLNNQPDALIILILFCYKTLHVSSIFSAHHQEFSTLHSAVVKVKVKSVCGSFSTYA